MTPRYDPSWISSKAHYIDVGYDVCHCVKDVVINMGLHGMDLWLQDHNPALVPELRSIFKAHTKKKKVCAVI